MTPSSEGVRETADISGCAGHLIAAQILQPAAIEAQAQIVELPIGQQRSIMTIDATCLGAEQVQPFQFLVIQCPMIAGDEAGPFRSRRS
ncbi:hypothetical protein [Sphingobium yanoikuyae]|uniref:hypothetical protein n=1 Tax=Sphingobium yanoikuyae TaxID=13690 RepID=UPI00345E86EC